jgi:FAD/FMN-containing dehydrogenase
MAGQLVDERFERLVEAFSGLLLRSGDAGYEDARRVHNGLVDKRPALIARCLGTADVVDALSYAREARLPVSVRGGGHNVAGRAVVDDGVVIDLSLMKGIRVDPGARTVRVQGGVTWRELNREAALHGLATTGGVISTTGVAGLTLGGGLGWLMGTHGLSVDNLLSVELVTASAEVVSATAEDTPDLFWALRGAGANFGVATSLEFRAYPLQGVVGGLVAHPFTVAEEALRFFRDLAATAPDELAVMPLLVHAPDGSGEKLMAFAVCHAGTAQRAETDLAPLLAFGSPVLAQVGPMPYAAINTMLDAGFPAGALNYWKSSFLTELSDAAIDTIVDRFGSCPSPMSGIVIEHFHGAVTRVGVTETPVPHRQPGFNLLIASEWTDPLASEENIAWTRATYAAMEPHFAPRRYLNYLDDDDTGVAVAQAYGPNQRRLSEVKRRYDPDNVFKMNHNIEPSGPMSAEAARR